MSYLRLTCCLLRHDHAHLQADLFELLVFVNSSGWHSTGITTTSSTIRTIEICKITDYIPVGDPLIGVERTLELQKKLSSFPTLIPLLERKSQTVTWLKKHMWIHERRTSLLWIHSGHGTCPAQVWNFFTSFPTFPPSEPLESAYACDRYIESTKCNDDNPHQCGNPVDRAGGKVRRVSLGGAKGERKSLFDLFDT